MAFLKDRNKRYLVLLIASIPFLIAIGIFSAVIIKDIKDIKNTATGTVETKAENIIESMNYILRDDATDIQKDYFAELKSAIEDENSEASEADIAGLVCKNFVADLYTWTNKQGQFDVSALYYVFTTQKDAIYLDIRDNLYKYINYYINQYGSNNLLEVEEVTVTKASKASYDYVVEEQKHGYDDENGHYYYMVEFEYPAYDVSVTWTYKENNKFDTSKYPTSMNFLVVEREGRYEVVEASQKTIDARIVETETETETDSSEDANDAE